MNIIKSGHVLQVTIKLVCSTVVTTNYSTKNLSVLAGAIVMAPNVKVFLQVALLCYVVTTSIGGIIDFQKALTTLQKEVEDLKQQSQEEINSLVTEIESLHHKNEQLEKRLEQIEAKG